ncbi:hypothetical protein M9Y10_046041 [Tritrichomonas musculus]|uniref:BTB domain-containing protein n=1 Tax=Tritrichomonas musculus TaxID=1915356 RepID=A0ABR2JWZ6_9EUKA
MNKVNISISSKGLKNLEYLPIDKDFTFIVGDKLYPTFKIVACILSPSMIAVCLKNDPNMKEYKLPFDDPQGYFQIIMDIAYDHEYKIDLENCFFIYRVAKLFENKDLEEIANIETNSRVTDHNCFQLLLKMKESNFPQINQIETYISQNFDSLISQRLVYQKDQNNNTKQTIKLMDDLFNLPIDLFSLIFKNDHFKFQKKTYSLLKFILDQRPNFITEFKKVVFEHSGELSSQDLQDFVGYIDDDDFPMAGEIIKDAVMRYKPK